jgi:hypothetical protein
MTAVASGSIVPITVTLGDKTGVTLFAPPWEDADGEQWEGFLGDGAKIVLFPSTAELKQFIEDTPENDLSDHPDWPRVASLGERDLRPTEDNSYDLEAVYEWAAGEPDAEVETGLGNVVELVLRIAESCEDGALRRLIGATPEYAELMEGEAAYRGSREARARWSKLGDTIAETWERALSRVERWLDWRGDYSAEQADELETAALWDRVGATPIELVFADDAIYLTVRGHVDEEALFLGSDGEIEVFEEPEDLAEFCRDAEEHELVRLEFWDEVRAAGDEEFVPDEEDSYDLRVRDARTAQLLTELVDFCDLEADAGFLGTKPIDPARWDALVATVRTCLILD